MNDPSSQPPTDDVRNRGTAGDAWAFAKAAGGGVKDAAVGTAEGLWSLGKAVVSGVADAAKGGYKLATDAEARQKAWDATKATAAAAKQAAKDATDYAGKVVDNPDILKQDAEEAFNAASDGANSLYNSFKSAKDKAEAEGRSAEFWGNITGQAGFEIGSMLIPVGALAKAGKAGKLAKGADKAADLAKAADKANDLGKAAKAVDKTEDFAKSANKAKQASKTPALSAPDCAPGPVGKCPFKSAPPAKAPDTAADLAKKATDDVASHPSLIGNFSKEAAEAANKKMARLKQLPLDSPEADKLLDELADMCVHGNGDSLVLGQWDQATGGYIAQAKKEGAKFFQTTDEFYDPKNPAMKDIAWALNERVLKKQLESGVPRIDYRGSNIADILLDPTAEGTARQKEVKYLLENARKHGYVREGNSWIKK